MLGWSLLSSPLIPESILRWSVALTQIDFQLQLAAESFINSSQVEIRPQEGTLLISRIFKWYRADFGGSHEAVLDMLLSFLDEGEKKDFLKKDRDRIRIKYQPYDWNLNQ
jgi:hypothetical protein